MSDAAVSSAGLPDDADVFTASFDVNLNTPSGGFVSGGLQFGMMFGMPATDSAATADGVTSITGNLPYAGLNVYTGNGTDIGTATPVGNQAAIFCAEQGPSTLSVSIVGKKNGTLTITYGTNLGEEATVTLQDITFDGFFSFYVEANNATFQRMRALRCLFKTFGFPQRSSSKWRASHFPSPIFRYLPDRRISLRLRSSRTMRPSKRSRGLLLTKTSLP